LWRPGRPSVNRENTMAFSTSESVGHLCLEAKCLIAQKVREAQQRVPNHKLRKLQNRNGCSDLHYLHCSSGYCRNRRKFFAQTVKTVTAGFHSKARHFWEFQQPTDKSTWRRTNLCRDCKTHIPSENITSIASTERWQTAPLIRPSLRNGGSKNVTNLSPVVREVQDGATAMAI